jgi:hypothetical protein
LFTYSLNNKIYTSTTINKIQKYKNILIKYINTANYFFLKLYPCPR